ncbi:MAG: sulfurtransferase TusA family protein [Candidatus Wallbacteria bacterium]
MSGLNDKNLDANIKPDITIDCLGLYCPVPVMNAQSAVEKMNPGEILEILATDEGVKSDFPLFCKSRKLTLLRLTEENGEFKIYIMK